jgi:hypothetical protein
MPTINSLAVFLVGVAHAVRPIKYDPKRISFLAIIGHAQRLDLVLHESSNNCFTMAASRRIQPLALSGEWPLYPCYFNRSTQHQLETELPGLRARGFCRCVVGAGAASAADGRTDISTSRIAMEPRQNRRSGCQSGKVVSISVDKRSVSH